MKKAVCFYISGHGFGHASRTMMVIKSLVESDPGLRIHIKTSAARWFIESNLSPECYRYHFQENDIGVVQSDSLYFRPKETFLACENFYGRKKELIRREVQWVEREDVGLIVSDIPPVAFEIAHKAQIPAVGVANFSWDWIYEAFLDDLPQYGSLVEQIREAYNLCDKLYRLPFHGDLSCFPNIVDAPIVARVSKRDRLETRRLLGLPENKKLILCSFGGIGIDRPVSFTDTSFALISTMEQMKPSPNTFIVTRENMKTNFINYQDLVAASDAVLTKLGYGIVSEAIANKSPLLYVDISAFREQQVFQREIARWVPALPVSRESLFEGGWEGVGEKILEMKAPGDTPPLNGAEYIAGDLARIIRDGFPPARE